MYTAKSVLSGRSKIDKTIQTDGSLMQVKRIAECSFGAHFEHSTILLTNRSVKPSFGLLLSGCLRQGLLYYTMSIETVI